MKGGAALPTGYYPSSNLLAGSPHTTAVSLNSQTSVVSAANSKGGASAITVNNTQQTSNYPSNYSAGNTSGQMMQTQANIAIQSKGDQAAIPPKGGKRRRLQQTKKRQRKTRRRRHTKRRYRKHSRHIRK